MKLPVLKSPFAGMPDFVYQLPSKPVRVTLSPLQALMLHTALGTLLEGLETVKPSDRQAELLAVLGEVQDLLEDKLPGAFA